MIPFMSEEIYQNLVRCLDKAAPESVHLCASRPRTKPSSTRSWRRTWTRCSQVVTLGRAARNAAYRKNRQPLARLYVHASERRWTETYQAIVLDELNIKELSLPRRMCPGFITYTFKPQLKILGQKYGKQVGDIRTALAALDGSAAKKAAGRHRLPDPSPARRRHPA